MTIPTSVLTKMATLGLSAEQAEVVASMLGEVEAATHAEVAAVGDAAKEKARARWHKWKDNHPTNVSKRLPTAANNSRGGVARVDDKTSNLEIEPQQKERNALKREFASFWSEFPNKVGKPKAEASFVAARKRASFEAIMSGLARYVAAKPADRAWLNPTTFLNQDRWDDQPGVVVPMARGSPVRPVDDLINSLVSQMDEADASTTTEIEGHSAAPLRLSARQW